MENAVGGKTCRNDLLRSPFFPASRKFCSLRANAEILPFRSFASSQLSYPGGLCLGRSGIRIICAIAGTLVFAADPACSGAQQHEPAGQLIREVVYNELHDHDTHGFWRYWVKQHTQDATRLEEEVETADGPVTRLVQTNGRPPDEESRKEEEARLEKLVNSPQELASHRKDYLDDEKHIALVMSMLPDAYLFEYAGDENGCHHVRYRPNPAYVPGTFEARVVHSMTGDLWIDSRFKRLSRLQGRLDENVDIGFGLLGRLDKGGWFSMQRIQVGPTEWKTRQLEVHLSGRAFVLKTIAHETSELRGGFVAVPAGITLSEGMSILHQTEPQGAPDNVALIAPATFTRHR